MIGVGTSETLRRTYRQAALELEAKKLRSGPAWRRLQEINAAHESRREAAEEAYRAEYQTRVEAALKARIDSAASVRREHNMIGVDRFERAALERQAHRDVQARHRDDLFRIDASKSEALEDLMGRARKDDPTPERTKDSFARAAKGAATRPAPIHQR